PKERRADHGRHAGRLPRLRQVHRPAACRLAVRGSRLWFRLGPTLAKGSGAGAFLFAFVENGGTLRAGLVGGTPAKGASRAAARLCPGARAAPLPRGAVDGRGGAPRVARQGPRRLARLAVALAPTRRNGRASGQAARRGAEPVERRGLPPA